MTFNIISGFCVTIIYNIYISIGHIIMIEIAFNMNIIGFITKIYFFYDLIDIVNPVWINLTF